MTPAFEEHGRSTWVRPDKLGLSLGLPALKPGDDPAFRLGGLAHYLE